MNVPAGFQRRRSAVLSALLFALVASPPLALAAEGIAGEWEMTMDFNGRVTYATLTIAAKPDGTFTGMWGRSELANVKFAEQKLTFTRTIRMGENEFTLNYEGALKDGKLSGALTSDRGTIAANGARKVPKPPVVGQWEMKYRMRDQDRTAMLTVSQKPEGTLQAAWKGTGAATGTGATAEHQISNVEFKDGKLSFARRTKMGEREFESTFAGAVTGDTLTGTIKTQMGDIEATGQRVGGALIGIWELVTTTDQGPRPGMLRIEPDMTGRYELFGGEIPVKDLKLEGNDLSFAVEMGFGDQTTTLTFKGKLDGKTLKGEVTSPRGTREVTGKKMGASPLVGSWQFTRETPQGTRTSTLLVKENMTGTYTVRDTAYDIQDLKVDGNAVTFKVTVKYGENEVPMEFKGTLEGTELKGAFTTERGTREAVGKKQS